MADRTFGARILRMPMMRAWSIAAVDHIHIRRAPDGGVVAHEGVPTGADRSQYVGGEMTQTATVSVLVGLDQRNGSRTMRKLSPVWR